MFTRLLLAACLAVNLAQAEDLRLIRSQPALASPDPLATSRGLLQAGLVVNAIERQGGWVRVRSEKIEGWVRVLSLGHLEGDTSAWSAILDLFRPNTGVADGRVTAVTGIRGLPTAGRPAAHALILTISEYGNGIPALPGVKQDADSAVLMARALGVADEQTIALADGALSLDGMRAALDGLDAEVMPNDTVFLYYSGHGTRLKTADGRCAEALVSADAQPLLDAELEQRLARIAAKARRMVVFLDACHAGGLGLRGISSGELAAKFWAKGEGEQCERPSNLLTRSLAQAEPGDGKLNYVYIAAARAEEVALDDAKRGGLATRAWLDCLAGSAVDLDHSAGLSAGEIADCAQPLVESMAAGNPVYSPPHLTLAGNAAMVLAPAQTAAPDAAAVLADIYANRDDRRRVTLTPDRTQYRIGIDAVGLTLRSSHPGYVYLLMAGSDGTSFDLLFPNQRDQRNFIAADETLTLPRSGWRIQPGGPAGQDRLLAVVSDTPRDFKQLGMQPSGPFSSLANTAANSRDIQFVSTSSAAAAKPQCVQFGKRNLQVVGECSDGYGAAFTAIDEIK